MPSIIARLASTTLRLASSRRALRLAHVGHLGQRRHVRHLHSPAALAPGSDGSNFSGNGALVHARTRHLHRVHARLAIVERAEHRRFPAIGVPARRRRVAVVSALARFSADMRMRTVCARRPVAAAVRADMSSRTTY